MSRVTFRHDCIILDACSAINLYASKQMRNILDAIPTKFAVADYVYKEEVLEIYGGSEDNVMRIKELVNLQPFIDGELLTIAVPYGEIENLDAVNFAYSIDDGEAVTGAIAKSRNWSIATDDVQAISFFKKEIPQIQLITTPEMIKFWVETAYPSPNEIRSVIKNVQLRGRYTPSKKHPLYDWWRMHGRP